MKYPQLQIDRQKLIYNTKRILEMTDKAHVNCHIVTKGFCAYRPMVDAMVEAGARFFADSRLDNFVKLEGYGSAYLLLRIPMITEATDVVRYCDLSLNSEYKTLCALSDAALAANRRHGVILMVELGDLREGFMPDEVVEMAGETLKLRGLYLAGLGTNFNCYGGVIGDEEKLNTLINLVNQVKEKYDIHLPIVSGGNSGIVYLLDEKRLPEGINHIRIGEALLFGRETSYGRRISDLYTDIFTLKAEVIECRRKPSVPYGEIGPNAFGETVTFDDYGVIRRAIVALGRHDVDIRNITPKISGIRILGSSSDHMLLDITKAVTDIEVGDIMEFEVNYGTMYQAMLSSYVHKRMV
ncbi:MAG TPA: alanine/ornithine racemase family PLP-dependent enzyme [Clostridiaceae bacterium]|nr:alanine/ornithine racemase family PLP-dependent enzyme [Clostridiaceae bacterium]